MDLNGRRYIYTYIYICIGRESFAVSVGIVTTISGTQQCHVLLQYLLLGSFYKPWKGLSWKVERLEIGVCAFLIHYLGFPQWRRIQVNHHAGLFIQPSPSIKRLKYWSRVGHLLAAHASLISWDPQLWC